MDSPDPFSIGLCLVLTKASHATPCPHEEVLDGRSSCRLSNLRNPLVPCHYHYNFPVDLKKSQCRMSIIYFLMSIGLMSHVDFKKRLCRPVEFKG